MARTQVEFLSVGATSLRREQITAQQAKAGPGSPRVLNSVEIASEALMRQIEEAKNNKVGTALKATRATISFGMIDLGLSLVSKLPRGLKLTRELAGDAAGYRTRQRESKASREMLRQIVWYEVMSPRFRELDAARAE